MVEDNKRWAKEREAEREADLAYRKKHGGKSKDDVMMKWVVGVPVVLFVLTFLVFMYAMLPLLIKIVIRATAEWSALLH
jgi:heme/copper-type cytochrome/quinol oxidase subunit 3